MKQGIGIILGAMVLFYAGIMVGYGLRIEANKNLPIRPDVAIQYLEAARESHQYFVDHPEEVASHMIVNNQDAEWVEIYTGIIKLIEELGRLD